MDTLYNKFNKSFEIPLTLKVFKNLGFPISFKMTVELNYAIVLITQYSVQ